MPHVVVDTNVIVYYLLGTEAFVDEVKAFWAAVTEPIAPARLTVSSRAGSNWRAPAVPFPPRHSRR